MYIHFTMPSGGDAIADFEQFCCREWKGGKFAIVGISPKMFERALKVFDTEDEAGKKLYELFWAMEAGKQVFDMKG